MKRTYVFGTLLTCFALVTMAQSAFAKDGLSYPSIVNFGPVTAPGADCKSIVLVNDGSSDISIDSIWIDADVNNLFSIGSWTHVTLKSHDSAMIHVCYELKNMQSSDDRAILQIDYSDDGGTTITNASIGMIGNESNTNPTTPCLTFDDVVFGPLLVGGTEADSIALTNPSNASVTITGATIDAGDTNFRVTSTFPFSIPANSTRYLMMEFVPTAVSRDSNTTYSLDAKGDLSLAITGDSIGCTSVDVPLAGAGTLPSNDTTRHSIAFINPDVIGLAVSPGHMEHSVTFVNNSSQAMHVASASLRNGNSFAIAGATPTLPFDLAPGKTLTLTIDVLAHKNGFYRDQLQLTTDHALTTTNFDLEAVYNDKVASVTMANESGVTIRVSPNPSSGSISIETSARSLSVEIVDVTGKIIATHQGGSSWKWDGTHSGVSVPNGTYLVRLAWSDASGRPFSEVRSVAIER